VIKDLEQIRRGSNADFDAIFAVINDAAQAYRGVIPRDQWHEPYMSREALADEIAGGVEFWVIGAGSDVVAVMGLQEKSDVALIRHAYTATESQGKGFGTKLLKAIQSQTKKPLLIGTWAEASWAIDFYLRYGFALVPRGEKDRLLRTYWSIPDRQIETSVVLADNAWMDKHGHP
jgi:N-acetylglutamate synthase-like GNAT family acetyltransferase